MLIKFMLVHFSDKHAEKHRRAFNSAAYAAFNQAFAQVVYLLQNVLQRACSFFFNGIYTVI